MARICIRCGSPAPTLQDMPPRSCSDPEHRILRPLCSLCHNYGPTCGNAVQQRLMNNIEQEQPRQTVTVNGTNATAQLGSVAFGTRVVEPSGIFSEHFVNLATRSESDFRILRSGSTLTPVWDGSGTAWCGYVFLTKRAGD